MNIGHWMWLGAFAIWVASGILFGFEGIWIVPVVLLVIAIVLAIDHHYRQKR